jgi:feruloyl-CoA synthase
VLNKIKPTMAFVDDAARYGAAISRPELDGVEIVASRCEGAPAAVTPFAELLRGDAGIDLGPVDNHLDAIRVAARFQLAV